MLKCNIWKLLDKGKQMNITFLELLEFNKNTCNDLTGCKQMINFKKNY